MLEYLNRPYTDLNKFHIIPEPPYEKYKIAYVRVCKRDKRRYIDFYHKDQKKTSTSYARYIFQVDYWNKYKQWIPEEYEVDHINENKLDDRLDNFQLLTGFNNRMKSAAFKPIKNAILVCPMCKKFFSRLIGTTQVEQIYQNKISCCSYSCSNLFRLCKISDDIKIWISGNQIVYIVDYYQNSQFPWCEITNLFSRDILNFDISIYENRTISRLKLIKGCLEKGFSYEKTEILLGIKSIDYLVYTYLPEYTQKSIITENARCIQKYLEEGKTVVEIAKLMNMTYGGIYLYIKKYFPSYQGKFRLKAIVNRIKECLDKGFSEEKIAKITGNPLTKIQHLIKLYVTDKQQF